MLFLCSLLNTDLKHPQTNKVAYGHAYAVAIAENNDTPIDTDTAVLSENFCG